MQLGWIDFSKEDREKALDVINMLREPGAVDEIGIGLLRDAFANFFFPGTSTVQTRAKYFLIVPYVLQEAVSGKYGNNLRGILDRIEKEERDCGLRLYNHYRQNEQNLESSGIIGSRVLPQGWVARKPSNIYWNGIRTLHIFEQTNMSIPEMVKLSLAYRSEKKDLKLGNRQDDRENDGNEQERDDKDAGRGKAMKFFDIPDGHDPDWKDSLQISLTQEEAVFLRKKIETSLPDTLFAYLLKNNIDVSKYDSFEALYEDLKDELPRELSEKMKLAWDFSRFVYAARVRYNMILSAGQNPDVIEEWSLVEENISWYIDVNLEEVMNMARRPAPRLRMFLYSLKSTFGERDFSRADKIIIDREIDIKTKKRAKLCHIENYGPEDWIGGRYLNYRFPDAKRIIEDIYEGETVHVSDE